MEEFLSIKYRLPIGILIFIILGIVDYIKNPKNPTKVKEYLFMFSVSILATIYAVIHDLITFTISKEYFVYGKNLGAEVVYFPDVFILAIKASYWLGIIIGIGYLVVNNPNKKYEQLNYYILYQNLIHPLLGAIIFALIGYLLSYIIHPYFTLGAEKILREPQRFESVAFIHWGTYLGTIGGTIYGAYKIKKMRLKFFTQ